AILGRVGIVFGLLGIDAALRARLLAIDPSLGAALHIRVGLGLIDLALGAGLLVAQRLRFAGAFRDAGRILDVLRRFACPAPRVLDVRRARLRGLRRFARLAPPVR